MQPGHSRYANRLVEFADLIAPDAGFAGGWTEWFARRIGSRFDGRIYCEVGCSDGDLLCAVAADNPTAGFVGIDWAFKSIHAAAGLASRTGLPNVGLIRGRAQELPRWFREHELSGLWVFQPDPVDRAGRLVAEPFLVSVHPLLKTGATVATKTDHPGYFQWIRAILGRPSPTWFFNDPSRFGPVPRVRHRDVESPTTLPPFSDEIARRFITTVDTADFWRDTQALAATLHQPYAGRDTPYEARYRAKRLPIYLVELTAACSGS